MHNEQLATSWSHSGTGDDRLRRLAARNDAILKTSMDGFFVVGEDYRFLEVNQAFANMLGYSVDELLDMTIVQLEAQYQGGAHGSSFVRTGLHQFPTAHRHKDGHIVCLEISVTVLHDDGRKIVVGFARDVTERRRAEDALTALTRQKKLILNSAGEGICGVDIDGTISFANPAAARMLGRTPGGMTGRCAADMFGADVAGLPRCGAAPVSADSSSGHLCETEFVRADGTRLPVEYTATSIDEHGRTVGAVLVFSDITLRKREEAERRRLEAQIQTNQKLEGLGLLAGGIAHDFNNILVGILGNACLAIDELSEDSPVRARIQRIVNAGQRASKVIHQILAYAGRARPDAEPLDLNELAQESLDFLAATCPPTVTLHLEAEADLPAIAADSGQIEQLLSNLVINAIEAIGTASGRVVARTRTLNVSEDDVARDYGGQQVTPGRYVALEVEDNGAGMTPDTLARIFEPFFSEKATGRGLGLAAIRGIVRAHGGGILVCSQRGKGTLFRALLPIADVPAATSAAARPVDATSAPTAPPCSAATVLVIDDEQDIREIVHDALESRGMRVLLAEDGERGVSTFRAHADEIDLVLLDMTMPRMDGRAVLREIHAIRPDARVVLSSGYSETDAVSRFADAGLAGFVHKPYTIAGLVDSLRRVLN